MAKKDTKKSFVKERKRRQTEKPTFVAETFMGCLNNLNILLKENRAKEVKTPNTVCVCDLC